MRAITREEGADLLRRLSRTPLFRSAPRFSIARLLAGAERVDVEPDELVCERGKPVEYIYVLLDGDYRVDGTVRVDLGTAGGGIVGIDVAVTEPRMPGQVTMQAVTSGSYVRIRASSVRTLYENSPPFRAAIRDVVHGTSEAQPRDEDPCQGALVRFESSIPETPLSFLIELLGREITASFPDRVIIVRRQPDTATTPQPVRARSEGPGALFFVEAGDDWVMQHHGDYDYVLLDTSESVLEAQILVKMTLGLRPTPVRPPAPEEPRVLHTMIVQPAAVPCARELDAFPANWPGVDFTASCRLLLSLGALRQLQPIFPLEAPLSTLDPSIRTALGIWARALTLRRTGVAIGGGGVFAFKGVYVLRRLVEEQVPIDVLTGASGGALVGCYFAAKGLAGLDQVVAEGDCGALDAMVLASMVSGAVMDSYLTCALGERCLEHMGPVEFYPAATDVSGGSGVVAVRGPLGLGVRAASSTPPIFGGTITNKMRLSDGAFTNNVPVQALEIFGADLTFGINCYPPSRLPLSPYLPTCAQRFLSVVSPLNRLMTFTSAFNLLGSVAGRIEGDFASVSFNANSPFDFPYLIMPNFMLASTMVHRAERDPELEAKVQCFVDAWKTLKARGSATRND